MLTSATGKSEATFTYDPYGNTTGTTGTVGTGVGYDGQPTSSDSGLIYLRARTYDPKTAQFVNADPLQALTNEPYTYAQDNPTSLADPSGLWLGIGWLPSPGKVIGTLASGAATVFKYSLPGQVLQDASSLTGLTLGGCLGGEAGVLFVSSVQFCYAATPSGQSCVTASYGSTRGAALGAWAGATVSNAQNCQQLSSWFSGGGGSLGPATGSFVNGECGVWQFTGGVGPQVRGLPKVGGWGGSTYTWVAPSF
jgi:RHS repeat-associated protein